MYCEFSSLTHTKSINIGMFTVCAAKHFVVRFSTQSHSNVENDEYNDNIIGIDKN